MKKIDVVVEKYQAKDGTVFDIADDCVAYENALDHIKKWFASVSDDGYREVWYVTGMNPPDDIDETTLSITQYAWDYNEIQQDDALTPGEFNQLVAEGKVEEIDMDMAYNILIGFASRKIESVLCDMTVYLGAD